MFLKNFIDYMKKYNEYASGNTYPVTLKSRSGSNINCTLISTSSLVYGWMPGRVQGSNGYQSGSLYYITNGSTTYYGNTNTGAGVYGGVIIGDGDTPPTYEDYDLSGNQITTFTATTSVLIGAENGKLTITATYNLYNNGASPFTIREIANTIPSSSDLSILALITRDVLETPVTINPGETGVLTYKMTIN